MKGQPLLCKLGFHNRYHYLPKVGGDLGEISIACKRCGYGYRYFEETWDIPPEEVQDAIAKQAQIEFGMVLGLCRGIGNPKKQLQLAFDVIKGEFSEEELEPIKTKYGELIC